MQDRAGVWRGVNSTGSNPQRILSLMQETQRSHPEYRVRAIDAQTQRVVDIL